MCVSVAVLDYGEQGGAAVGRRLAACGRKSTGCVEVASRFYASLLGRGVAGRNGRELVSALREAAMTVRATEIDMPFGLGTVCSLRGIARG